jgi:lysozyme
MNPLQRTVDNARKLVAKRRKAYKAAKARLAARRKARDAWRPTRLSDQGIALLKREEGVVPYAYNDPAGHATFGVGHLIHLGRVTAADVERWGSKAHPKPELVTPTLKADIRKYEDAVREATGNKLRHKHQFDACVSLAFNIGIGGFRSSSVARHIRDGRLNAAADAFLLWDNPSMLRPRRERERRLFLTGVYPL